MNESIDLTKILKDCPKGTKLYTTVWGEVTFNRIDNEKTLYPILIETDMDYVSLTKEGHYTNKIDADCILFPSENQRDWSKFEAPWYKKDKFDPNTLKPFDRVIARDANDHDWKCDLFSHIKPFDNCTYKCAGYGYIQCIPYNDETKHLVGTTEKAPEYYRYWEK